MKMNEIIKQLADQSTDKWLGGEFFDREKFAELILKECCDILTDNVEVALNASGSPVYPEGLIRKHFGVER